MKTYTQDELKSILDSHQLWLNEYPSGVRADLRSADLRSADLRSADLRSADLRSADLRSANLSYANLRSADLRSANLRSADLRSANLRSADLRSANLSYANLRSADLRSADLRSANLSYANLRSADLRSANLSYANLSYANLRSADLSSADLSSADLSSADLSELKAKGFHWEVCPQEGSFIAFKKVLISLGSYKSQGIVKLSIPQDSKRVSAISSRKCRAEKATVLNVIDVTGAPIADGSLIFSNYDNKVLYKVGETVVADMFDEDPKVEYANGIHFFITREEAEQFSF